MKNALKPLPKTVLIPSATYAAIYKKNVWIKYDNINILNEEINDIMKIVKSLE